MLYLDRKYLLLLSNSLRNFKQKSSNLFNFSCPVCHDSEKKSTKARGYAMARSDHLHVYCHNCQYSSSFSTFLKNQNYNLHAEYLFEKFQHSSTPSVEENFKQFISSPKFDKLIEYSELPLAIRCDHLPETHYCIKYLQQRKIPISLYKLLQFTEDYKQFIQTLIPHNEKEIIAEPRLIIPFYDEYNDLLAVSGRSFGESKNKLRYVTVRTTDSIEKLIYGLERINKNVMINICEGPLDSLHVPNCVAAGNADLIAVAEKIGTKNVRLIWDNERYNKNILSGIDKAMSLGYNVVIWPDSWKYKDINDAVMGGETLIEKVLTDNTFSGIIGKMKFNSWKR
jgi:hypothetical protein